MWRLKYSIIVNIPKLYYILESMHRMADRQDLYSEQETYDYVREKLVGLLNKSAHIRTECYGTENLPEEGGYVLYPNHQGVYDGCSIITAHEKALTGTMEREASYTLILDDMVKALRGKRLDLQEKNQVQEVMEAVTEEVKQGRRYCIFPEGGYNDEKRNTLWEFNPVCFEAAVKAGAPIVPVALVDSYKVCNSGTVLPVKPQVHFLKPLCWEEYRDMDNAKIAAEVKGRIQQKLTEAVR